MATGALGLVAAVVILWPRSPVPDPAATKVVGAPEPVRNAGAGVEPTVEDVAANADRAARALGKAAPDPELLEKNVSWEMLDEVTEDLRRAREDLASLSSEERQQLFREAMTVYDKSHAAARLAGAEAEAELSSRYPEFRELMVTVKPD